MSTGSHSYKDVVCENQERKTTMCMWLGTISDVINNVTMQRN